MTHNAGEEPTRLGRKLSFENSKRKLVENVGKLKSEFGVRTRKMGSEVGYFFKSPKGGKVCFVVSINYISFAFIILTGYPQYYWLLHNVFIIILFTLRFVYYKYMGWHYYLFEFCYFCNYYLLIGTNLALMRWFGLFSTFLARYNPELLRSFFLLVEGPLAWSVLLFRNSMVFHNFDQMTSLWLHVSAAVVGWCFRWHSDKIESSFPGLFAFDTELPMPYWENFKRTVLIYLLTWLIPHYFLLFRFLRNRIKSKGYDTLFILLTAGKGFLKKPLEKFKYRIRTKVYCFLHFLLFAITSNLAFIWWHNKEAHTAFLFTIYVITAWNGATYYYTAFIKQHSDKDAEGNVIIKSSNVKGEPEPNQKLVEVREFDGQELDQLETNSLPTLTTAKKVD